MSITSPRLTASPCTLLLPRFSCQEPSPEFGADHPDDAACRAEGKANGSGEDGGLVNASCITNAECTAPAPVYDRARSMCVPCTAAESSLCRGTTPTCSADDTCWVCVVDADCESSTCVPDGSSAAPLEVLHAAPGVTDNCKFAFSDIGPATFAGTATIVGDPQFVDSATGDFHLLAAPPARDPADPTVTLAVGLDMGAYENQ